MNASLPHCERSAILNVPASGWSARQTSTEARTTSRSSWHVSRSREAIRRRQGETSPRITVVIGRCLGDSGVRSGNCHGLLVVHRGSHAPSDRNQCKGGAEAIRRIDGVWRGVVPAADGAAGGGAGGTHEVPSFSARQPLKGQRDFAAAEHILVFSAGGTEAARCSLTRSRSLTAVSPPIAFGNALGSRVGVLTASCAAGAGRVARDPSFPLPGTFPRQSALQRPHSQGKVEVRGRSAQRTFLDRFGAEGGETPEADRSGLPAGRTAQDRGWAKPVDRFGFDFGFGPGKGKEVDAYTQGKIAIT